MERATRWHLLTGEYPPQPGGISDYSELVAAGLARAGATVEVWTVPTSATGTAPETSGVTVHRVADAWEPSGLARIAATLDAEPSPRRLLVQYAPNVWGRKGLNLEFCRWLRRRRDAGDRITLMVHEVRYPFWLRDRPWRWLLTVVHRRMIREALASADRVFHTTLANGADLRRFAPRRGASVRWLPVPSTVPVVADPEEVAALRARLAPPGAAIIGTFGTYGGRVQGLELLERVLVDLLSGREDRVGVLLGRRGDQFAASLRERHPGLRDRLVAPGGLPADLVSRHLQACDLMVQPYEDGVSARRTTVMAALAHGLAVATTSGPNTEPIWSEAGAVALAPFHDPAALVAAAENLLVESSSRAELGAAARRLYDARFAVERTVSVLREDDTPAVEIERDGPRTYTETMT